MADGSVANVSTPQAPALSGSEHGIWIGDEVLTIVVDKDCDGFPPSTEQCKSLDRMIQGLARAIKSVTYQAENDTTQCGIFVRQPIEDLADAIILLSQMSEAVRHEMARGEKAAACEVTPA